MVACSFTPCGQMFVTGSTYGDLRLWDLDMNQLHAEKNTHDLGVTCCCFGPKILSGDHNIILLPPSFELACSQICLYEHDNHQRSYLYSATF
jgi:WD40 repeat protein